MNINELLKAKEDSYIYFTDKEALAAVKENGDALKYVKDQTPEICLAAVKENGYALVYVKDQTPEICLAAVKKNAYALKYVKDQTPEICLAAVKESAYALKYVNQDIFNSKGTSVKQYLDDIIVLIKNIKDGLRD